MKFIKSNLIDSLEDVKHDIVKYKYVRMKRRDLRSLTKMITLFETLDINKIQDLINEKSIKPQVKALMKEE